MVGSEGVVCGVDIDSEQLEELRVQSAQRRLNNIRFRLAAAEQVALCERCADMVFVGAALHDFKDPLKALQNARSALRPDGKFVNLDWKKEPTPFGPPVNTRFSESEAAALITSAGYNIVSIGGSGPYHYVIVENPFP